MFFKSFKAGMRNFGDDISVLVNTVLLSLVYFIGVGISFIIGKILKKKFLDTSKEKKDSYWNELKLKKKSNEEYYRQF